MLIWLFCIQIYIKQERLNLIMKYFKIRDIIWYWIFLLNESFTYPIYQQYMIFTLASCVTSKYDLPGTFHVYK